MKKTKVTDIWKAFWVETFRNSNVLHPERFVQSDQSVSVCGRICGEGKLFFIREMNNNDDECNDTNFPQFRKISEIVAGDFYEYMFIMTELSTLMFDFDAFPFVVEPLPTLYSNVMPCSPIF